MKSVARRVSDRQLLQLVKALLEMPVEETDERGRKQRTTRNRDEGKGTPQGRLLSPLLSNLYMRRFILGWRRPMAHTWNESFKLETETRDINCDIRYRTGRRFAWLGQDRRGQQVVHVIDVDTGKEVRQLKLEATQNGKGESPRRPLIGFLGITLSEGGKWVMVMNSSSQKEVTVWNLENGKASSLSRSGGSGTERQNGLRSGFETGQGRKSRTAARTRWTSTP